MKKYINLLLIIHTFLFLACQKDPSSIQPIQSFIWPVSTPEEQGIQSDTLEKAYREAESRPFIYSMVIVRNGYLIGERYFGANDRDSTYDIMSVSKSFISALVGIAFRERYLIDLDQKMMDFLPEYRSIINDTHQYTITIRHLLCMKAGFDNSIEDYEENWSQWINSQDWIQHALLQPLRDNPGERFAYITAETHILSVILAKATKMTTLEFAQKALFKPLKIKIQKWERDPQGYYIGGMRMHFKARDLARFGYLYLNKGRINDYQIIPEDWVENSLAYQAGGDWQWGQLSKLGYGYLWWIGEIRNYHCNIAIGYGGQFIFIFPDLNMIIVATSDYQYYKDIADQHERSIVELVDNYILVGLIK